MTVTVTVDVDVDMSDFDTEDLIEELQSRGEDTTPHNIDIERIRHLLMCGMIDEAKDEAWQMIQKTLRATA